MTITNTQIRNSVLALAAVLFVAISFAIAPKAQASGPSGYEVYDFGPADIGGGYEVYDFGAPVGGYEVYDFGAPEMGGWSYPVSTFGSYGGWSYPVSSFGGTGGTYVSQNQAQSQSQTSTNVNNNVNNVNVNVPASQPTVVYQTQPVYQPVYQAPQYDYCQNFPGIQTILPAGYYVQNGNCYQNYVQPVYPTQPYVTLSAVPYTGLELGTTGTIIYWGFLVAWCLLAAYLIAVKKVHNKIAAWFMGSEQVETKVAYVAPAAAATTASAEFSGIDPFIASQIRR